MKTEIERLTWLAEHRAKNHVLNSISNRSCRIKQVAFKTDHVQVKCELRYSTSMGGYGWYEGDPEGFVVVLDRDCMTIKNTYKEVV